MILKKNTIHYSRDFIALELTKLMPPNIHPAGGFAGSYMNIAYVAVVNVREECNDDQLLHKAAECAVELLANWGVSTTVEKITEWATAPTTSGFTELRHRVYTELSSTEMNGRECIEIYVGGEEDSYSSYSWSGTAIPTRFIYKEV